MRIRAVQQQLVDPLDHGVEDAHQTTGQDLTLLAQGTDLVLLLQQLDLEQDPVEDGHHDLEVPLAVFFRFICKIKCLIILPGLLQQKVLDAGEKGDKLDQ